MDKNLINKVIWWIPLKNVRNIVRDLLIAVINIDNNINNLNNNIKLLNDKVDNLNNNFNELNNKINNLHNVNLLDNKVYEYDFIFSIGNNCFTAEILRDYRIQLRKHSFPLDWLGNVDIYSILDIINNKFNRFLEFKDLVFLFKDTSNIFHYKNKYNNFNFPHEFKSDKINMNEYLLIKEKYERRINRTINCLNNSRILMVYIGYREPTSHKKLIDTNRIINMIKDIRKNYNNNNIDLLYIQHYPYKNKNMITFKNIDDIIHLYQYDNTPKGNTGLWMGDIEKTIKVLKKYRLTK